MMIGLGCSRYAALRGPFRTGLIFLFHLAWKSRIRLPVLIAIGLMVLDIRMQLEINIDLGRGGRQIVPLLGQGNGHQGNIINLDDIESDDSSASEDDDSDSYTTDSYTVQSDSNTDGNEDDVKEENN